MKRLPSLLPLLALMFGLIGLSSRIHPQRYPAGRSRDPVATVRMNQSSLARILGEFRTGLSDMLFIKTERYLHGGVGYVPHLTEQLLTVQGTEAAVEHQDHEECEEGCEAHDHDHDHTHDHDHDHDDAHEHDHAHHDGDDDLHFQCPTGVETLIPTAERDYRGWIGRMQRTVKPWRDPDEPHIHGSGQELIPWFRMMTLSDPGYIRGYVLGAFWVQRADPQAALDFVEEGLRHNPEAFQLHLSKGYLLMGMARDLHPERPLHPPLPDQQALLMQAKTAFQTAADHIAEARPSPPAEGDITDLPNWNTYQETDAMGAITLSLLFEQRYGNPERLTQLRETYRQVMPDHPRL